MSMAHTELQEASVKEVRTRRKTAKKLIKSEAKTLTQMPKSQTSSISAAKERSRVKNMKEAFQSLQDTLPSVPLGTKLSKLSVLVLATNYIAHLTEILDQDGKLYGHPVLQQTKAYLQPVKRWPMRSLLYCGNFGEKLNRVNCKSEECHSPTGTTMDKGQ